MALDTIKAFLDSGTKFRLDVLLTCHTALLHSLKSAKVGCVDEYDLVGTIRAAAEAHKFTPSVVSVYAALILESCLMPTMTPSGVLVFQLKTATEAQFMKSIIQVLSSKASQSDSVLETLGQQYEAHVRRQCTPVDSAEFVTRLRKFGFDILFPPTRYDKVQTVLYLIFVDLTYVCYSLQVLSCIYVALRAVPNAISHKDIIDMVMVVKVWLEECFVHQVLPQI
jgi:hypothetical protein